MHPTATKLFPFLFLSFRGPYCVETETQQFVLLGVAWVRAPKPHFGDTLDVEGRGPRDHINIRMSHSGFKAQHEG